MDCKLRLGEVYFLKDEWKISLTCTECGLETGSLEHFLLHAMDHSLSVSADDVNGLMKNLNDYVIQELKEEVKEELVYRANDTLGYTITITEETDTSNETTTDETTKPLSHTISESPALGDSPELVKLVYPKKPVKKNPKMRKTEDGYQCSYCDRLFEKVSTCYMHIRTHTNPLRCEFCGLMSDSSYQHTVHRNRHLGIKPYDCKECGKRFASKAEVRLHNRSHTGERPYVCQECGRSYTNSSHLAVHRRRHTNERLYTCTLCDKAFFTKPQLSEHENSHSEERKYVCSTCNKSFKAKSALRQHMKLHAEKKYTCKVCDKKFAQSAGIWRHMKSHSRTAEKLCKEGVAEPDGI